MKFMSSEKLDDLIKQIFVDRELRLKDFSASLELMTGAPKYELYPNSHPFTSMFRINEPGYGLHQTGKYSQEFEQAEPYIQRSFRSILNHFEI